MSERPHGVWRNRALALLGVAGLAFGTVVNSTPALAAPSASTATYIVQLDGLPAASYTGGVPGYSPTKPAPGQKIDVQSEPVTRYSDYLTSRHEGVLDRVPKAKKVYDYTLTFNGFAAEMTSTDAAKLMGAPGVLSVTKNEIRKVDTVSTPEFLGLTASGGLWERLGGSGPRGAGDGIVVGLLDTGIWPESASFAPLSKSKKVRNWNGTCVEGEEWTADTCNNKIIGARFYTEGFGGPDRLKELFPFEYLSARDADGHGSHTASTAAGNFGVDAAIGDTQLGKVSGMAPNARLAMYKVCWGSDQGGCATIDSMKAIEDATADGVDVLNFSISGSLTSMVDPVELQMLFAADAGVFVAMSAGNSGPGASTVAHNDPWVTTVAAGTHDRVFTAGVVLGDGTTLSGAGLGAAVPSAPMALSTEVGNSGADPQEVQLCFPGTLDPTKVTGKIIVCDRGVNARTDKSAAVAQAGGVGMVLANVSPSSLNADLHAVPTVHVNETDGATIKAFVSGATEPTGSLTEGERSVGRAPMVAGFSSRGPALASADLLKPDILSPGVDVLAAVSPDGNNGQNFNFLSGTSMASPHVAGLGALLSQLHPNWSPMQIKSALMTTASPTDNQDQPLVNDDGSASTPFDTGSGAVTPNSAADPGLVYDSGFEDWVRFLCGAGQLALGSAACQTLGSIDPSDLNTPNIAIGELTGAQQVTRTVTNVSKRPGVYTPQVEAPAGVNVSVSPARLFLPSGKSASFTVSFERSTAEFNEYTFGSLTWSDSIHDVRSTLVVRPVAVAAPAELAGSGESGSAELSVRTGFEGTLEATAAGLVAGRRDAQSLSNPTGSGFDTANPSVSDHTMKVTVTVPEGTALARFQAFDADHPVGTDLDVFVFEAGTANLVGASASATSEEVVDLTSPPAGDYDVYVDLFALAEGQSAVDATVFSWSLGSASAGNLTVTPASQDVTLAGEATVTAAWTGLTGGTRYLGQVVYANAGTPVGSTMLKVNA